MYSSGDLNHATTLYQHNSWQSVAASFHKQKAANVKLF
jgi:hypothetical protein